MNQTIELTQDELRVKIAKLQGWTNLRWKDAGSDGMRHWSAGWYGDGPHGSSYLAFDVTREIAAAMELFDEMPLPYLRKTGYAEKTLCWECEVERHGARAFGSAKEVAISLTWYQWKTGVRVVLKEIE